MKKWPRSPWHTNATSSSPWTSVNEAPWTACSASCWAAPQKWGQPHASKAHPCSQTGHTPQLMYNPRPINEVLGTGRTREDLSDFTFDHRCVAGAEAARCLAAVIRDLQ